MPVVLDLSTPLPARTVQIDDAAYQLATPRLMAPLHQSAVMRGVRRLEALVQQDTHTAEEIAELAGLPDVLCRMVLDAPDDVHARLTDHQRMAVISAFLGEPA